MTVWATALAHHQHYPSTFQWHCRNSFSTDLVSVLPGRRWRSFFTVFATISHPMTRVWIRMQAIWRDFPIGCSRHLVLLLLLLLWWLHHSLLLLGDREFLLLLWCTLTKLLLLQLLLLPTLGVLLLHLNFSMCPRSTHSCQVQTGCTGRYNTWLAQARLSKAWLLWGSRSRNRCCSFLAVHKRGCVDAYTTGGQENISIISLFVRLIWPTIVPWWLRTSCYADGRYIFKWAWVLSRQLYLQTYQVWC